MLPDFIKNISKEDLEKFELLKTLVNGNGYVSRDKVRIKQFNEEYGPYIKSNYSIAYWVSVELGLKHLTKFFPENMCISDIRLKEVEKFMEHLKTKAPKGYRVYYRTLKAAFNKAIDWGYITENPFKKYKLPKKQINQPLFISEETLNKIITRIYKKANKIGCNKNKRNSLLLIADIIISGFYTGMRLSELINLRWVNVNFTKKRITVGDHQFTTKGRKQRIIPICDKLAQCLDKRAKIKGKNDEYVFGISAKRTFTKDYVSKTFKAVCKEENIDERIHFHNLRNSFASYLVQQGVSIYHLKELLGHSSVTTTEIYSHLNEEVLEQAISKFN